MLHVPSRTAVLQAHREGCATSTTDDGLSTAMLATACSSIARQGRVDARLMAAIALHGSATCAVRTTSDT